MFPNLETVKHGMVFVQKSHKLEHFCFHLFVFTWRRLDSKNGQIEFWAKETTSQTMACSWWRCLALLGVLFLKQLPLSISYIYIHTVYGTNQLRSIQTMALLFSFYGAAIVGPAMPCCLLCLCSCLFGPDNAWFRVPNNGWTRSRLCKRFDSMRTGAEY